MNTTGTSCSSRRETVLRPMRRCNSPNGSGRSCACAQASSSPSSRRPAGQCGLCSSAKRSVTSSSPRDQTCSCPCASTTSWARMPSHFHSQHQPLASPSVACSRCAASSPGATTQLCDRKKGTGPPSAGAGSSGRGCTRRCQAWALAGCCMKCISRASMSWRGWAKASASAAATMARETPTRSPPVISLLSAKHCAAGSARHQACSWASRAASSASRSAGRCCCIHSASGRAARPSSLGAWAGGSSRAMVSARSPTLS